MTTACLRFFSFHMRKMEAILENMDMSVIVVVGCND